MFTIIMPVATLIAAVAAEAFEGTGAEGKDAAGNQIFTTKIRYDITANLDAPFSQTTVN